MNPPQDPAAAPADKMETEVVVYAKIGNFQGFQKASNAMSHVQVEGSFKSGARCRVRKIIEGDVVSHELTMKIKSQAGGIVEANEEYTTPINADFFEAFRKVAEKSVVKNRYVFLSEKVELKFDQDGQVQTVVVPNIKYEVDVYQKKDGQPSEWCKIDVEIDSVLKFLNENHPELKGMTLKIKVSHLPFEPSGSILVSAATEEQHAFMSDLWDNEFNRAP